MRLISVNVGLPRDVYWRGRVVSTGIFKQPVQGPVDVIRHNLAGDQQADLTVHGGASKAVYAYPSEHYDFWRGELPGTALAWGHFGENLTVEGLVEERVGIGDRFRVGTAVLVVTQPRLPCFKLGLRFGDPGMVRRFLESGRSGFYLAVQEEGQVEAGDPIELIEKNPDSDLRVGEVARLYSEDRENQPLLSKAVATKALPASWREQFERTLASMRSR